MRELALTALRDFHAKAPDEPGPDAGRLRRMASPDLPQRCGRRSSTSSSQERTVMRNGPWLHLPEHIVTLSDSDRELAQQLQPLIARRRLDPPWVRDLAAAVHQPEERVRQVLRKQVTQGSVYQVVHDLFYDSDRIGELAGIVAALARGARRRQCGPLSRRDRARSQAHDPDPGVLRSHRLHAPRARCARAAYRTAGFWHGRHTHPVVRLGFKPRRGRQTLPGRRRTPRRPRNRRGCTSLRATAGPSC